MTESESASAHQQNIVDGFECMFKAEDVAPPSTVFDHRMEIVDFPAVPVERYISDEFHRLEVARVWPKVWQVVGWAEDIRAPGDTLVYDCAGISAVVVRQRDGSIKAFHNSCLHRGMRLCNETGNRSAIRCPFHSFTWDLNGTCRFIPEGWDFPQIEKSRFSLPELHVDQWQGYVFVNADPDARPLSSYLGSMPGQWKEAGWNLKNRFKAAHVVKKIPANWKVAQEAFMESFHGPSVHADSIMPAAPLDAMRQDVYRGEKHFARGVGAAGVLTRKGPPDRRAEQDAVDHFIGYYAPEFSNRPGFVVAEGETARDVIWRLACAKMLADQGCDISHMKRFDAIDYVWYNVFPNFMPWPTLGYPLGYWFRPDGGPRSSTMDIVLLLPFEGDRPPSAEPVVVEHGESCAPVLGTIGEILDEDMANMPLLQRGLEASATGHTNLARFHESRIRHFHRTLGEYVSG